MKIKMTLLVFAMVFIGLSGCKKDSGPTEPPPIIPPGSITETEPNDVTPQSLGTLSTTDITVSGSTASATDIDFFSVQLAGTTNLHASVSWTGGNDIDLGVMDPAKVMINYRDTGTNPEQCTLTARPAGTYIVQISTKSAGATAYVLRIGPR